MNDILYFDPLSLSLWVNTGYLYKTESLQRAIEHSLEGSFREAREQISKMGSEAERLHGTYILSNIHHEKRHFLDMVLTNYGSRYFRNLFISYHNQMALLKVLRRQNAPIIFPVRSFRDPIRSEALLDGETIDSSIMSEFKPFFEDLKYREDLFNHDNQKLRLKEGVCIAIGGSAQFESLAFMSQLSYLHTFGIEDYEKIFYKFFQKSREERMEYRWHEDLAYAFDALPRSVEGNRKVINTQLLTPLLYGALNGPFRTAKKGTLSSWVQPSGRLIQLLNEAKKLNLNNPKITTLEGWEITNQICKRIFGKTVLEDIELDIVEDEKLVESFKGKLAGWSDDLKICYTDFLELRKQLFSTLKNNPEYVLDPWESVIFVNRMNPIPVFVDQRTFDKVHEDGRIIFDYTIKKELGANVDASWVWVYSLNHWPVFDDAKSFKEIKAWQSILMAYAPICKLFLAGRSYPCMIGEELAQAERTIMDLMHKVIFDPAYSHPKLKMSTNRYWNTLDLEEAHCDFCSAIIGRGKGTLLSPWMYKASDKAREFIQARRPALSDLFLFQDWSNWIVCDGCVSEYSPILDE